MSRIASGFAVFALLAGATACGTGGQPQAGTASPRPEPTQSVVPSLSLSAKPPTKTVPRHKRQHAPTPTGERSPRVRPVPRVTKLLVFMVENHSLDQMRSDMPFTFGLAQRYGYATGYHALRHPSLPNYLGIAGGSTFGVADDLSPARNPVRGQSVFGQALALGKTAKLYADGMPTNCATTNGGHRYVVKHNPWAYFVDERSRCQQFDVPLSELSRDVDGARLPNAGMVIPDMCHDAHECDLTVADGWLREQVGRVLLGRDWRSGRLAVVITADEDDHHQGNLVLMTVLEPRLAGVVHRDPLDHYSLTRLYDEVLDAPLLGQAASAPSIAEAFGLHLHGSSR